MISGKFDPSRFFNRPDSVAIMIPADELFGFLKRSLDLPSSWAALVRRSTGDHTLVTAGGDVSGDDAEDIFFVRTTPVDLTIKEEGLVTKDQFQGRASVHLQVLLGAARGELLAFQKAVLGSHRAVVADRLVSHLQPAIRTALVEFASRHEAGELAGSSVAQKLSQAVTKAIEPLCFAAGLTLSTKPRADFHSQTFQQVQQARQEAARRREEHQAAQQVRDALGKAQHDHLDHLTSLLTRLSSLATDSPGVDLPELIRTFSDRERGELYEALFAAEQPIATTQWIIVAAGDEVLFFDPKDPSKPSRRLTVVGEAGPVRSIQMRRGADGQLALWLGASTGVYRLPIDQATTDLTLRVLGVPGPKGGFNSVVTVGNRVFASHSELGLFEWDTDKPTDAKACFTSMAQTAKAVRNVQFFEGDLLCSIDDRIIRWSADDESDKPQHIYTGSYSVITSLCPTADGVYAGNSDGDVLYWAKDKDTRPERLHMGNHRATESLWLLDVRGVKRLIFADTSMRIHARVLGDTFTCHYEAGGQTLRRIEVAPDLLVATNELRDRLICWQPGSPSKPAHIIGVSSICGRSIQDVALVARA